jgi:hypothetical protein
MKLINVNTSTNFWRCPWNLQMKGADVTIGEMKSKREVQNRGVEWNLSWLEALKLIQHKKRKGRRGNETRGGGVTKSFN